MQQLSLFRGVHDTQPRPVTLEELVTMMRTDQSVRDLTEKHRYARSAGDEQGASRYKKMMTSFGVAARFEGGRQQKHIVELTGLSLVDIDHIPAERMSEVLALVRGDEHTLLAYTTLSGQGVRIIAGYETPSNLPLYGEALQTSRTINDNTPNDSPHRGGDARRAEGVLGGSLYKQVFLTINTYYQNLTGLPTDGQCKNVGRISTIAYDENLYYNPDATPFVIKLEEKKPVGRPKRVESGKMKVERCESQVLRELERRGIVYEAGTYNKYVSAFCYEMNRYGVPEEECREWAVNRFDDYNTPEVEAIVRSCYAQTEEHGTVRVPRTGSDKQASVAQIEAFLAERVQLRRNVVTGFVEVRETETPSNLPLYGEALQASLPNNSSKQPEGAPHRGGAAQRAEGVCGSPYRQFTDDDRNSLWRALSTGLTTRPKEFNTIIESDFYPTYNPLHEYLEHLPAWDGVTDHIDQLASTVHVTGCTQEMHNRFFKKWIVAMVAAWMDETVTNHEILTYIGPQGRYKTTFMTRLLPPTLGEYFATKTFKGRMDKDDRLALTELALIDLEELDVMNASEVNQLKALVTDPSVNLRPVYARYSVRRAHIASFCGTGNNPRFLTDLTGHRRWLPFMIESIDSPYEHPFDYKGIYAQAYALYREGFCYWFTDEENAELEQHNRQFEEPCIEEELIRTYLRKPYGEETGEFLTATRIIELVGTSVRVSLSPKRIAMAMQRLGYEQRRVMNTRGWNVVILTGDQIKEQQRMDAHRSVEE